MGKVFVTKVDFQYVYSNYILNIGKKVNWYGILSSWLTERRSQEL